jgi:ABC-2 type transport system ATP-binding protein
MLKVSSLTKKYGKVTAADNLSFENNGGEVCAIMGPNGAGKSTTIKCICGLLRFEGNITIGGYTLDNKQARRLFGYVPETPSVFDLLTIREHMEFIASAYGISDYEADMNDLFKRFDLEDKLDKVGKELSKGMQQKLSICCAAIIHPKLLLLDEPMVGLDPKAIKELKKLVLELKESGCAVLISTHIIDSITGLWDRVLIMKDAKVIRDVYCKEMENEGKTLEELFFEVTGVEE